MSVHQPAFETKTRWYSVADGIFPSPVVVIDRSTGRVDLSRVGSRVYQVHLCDGRVTRGMYMALERRWYESAGPFRSGREPSSISVAFWADDWKTFDRWDAEGYRVDPTQPLTLEEIEALLAAEHEVPT